VDRLNHKHFCAGLAVSLVTDLHSPPREGTKIRALYDALHRGEIVVLGGNRDLLRDVYGLELERVYVSPHRGCRGTRLIGSPA
jgi:hypothetical protein